MNKYKIFSDPITKKDLEGVAKVKEVIRQDIAGSLILAYVEFDNELGEEYIRTVDKKDKIL